MLDFIKIDRLCEDDFTEIIESIGGRRYSIDDSREKIANADYVLNDFLIELKFVDEEGLEKSTRQKKNIGAFYEIPS